MGFILLSWVCGSIALVALAKSVSPTLGFITAVFLLGVMVIGILVLAGARLANRKRERRPYDWNSKENRAPWVFNRPNGAGPITLNDLRKGTRW